MKHCARQSQDQDGAATSQPEPKSNFCVEASDTTSTQLATDKQSNKQPVRCELQKEPQQRASRREVEETSLGGTKRAEYEHRHSCSLCVYIPGFLPTQYLLGPGSRPETFLDSNCLLATQEETHQYTGMCYLREPGPRRRVKEEDNTKPCNRRQRLKGKPMQSHLNQELGAGNGMAKAFRASTVAAAVTVGVLGRDTRRTTGLCLLQRVFFD